ncbi:hypothetical protein [Microbacterium sp. GCS4]|uniref:hypothetical protein n=1 Tax=Microbacterium sp. GCS4 TaxID=1692239 RepID=UPI00068238DB|nr:hypothetical protein [Microbacterium sp. GCS4]KNY07063.1 hypothetical protein AKH00_01755 [Microbacterium sp. GCS4]
MRKTSAVLATLSLAALALSGCAAAPSFAGDSCDRAGNGDAVSSAVTVEGEFGSAPDVEVFSPVKFPKTSFEDIVVGDGIPLVNETQVMTTELSIYSATTGEMVFQSPYADDSESLSNIATLAPQFPGLASVLECATGGSRIVAGIPADGVTDETRNSLGLDDGDAAIVVVDLLKVYPSRADGALQFNDARNMPTVVRAADGTPGVIIPDTDAPDELTTQTLIKGDGAKVEADQTPLLNLTVVGWDDREVKTTTWGANPSLDLPSTAPEVAQALVGETVGSQVLVVTPASDSGPALAYVIDILGAVTAR